MVAAWAYLEKRDAKKRDSERGRIEAARFDRQAAIGAEN